MSIDKDNSEKRVAQILGTTKKGGLPQVSLKTLETYWAYLEKNLKFPFEAEYTVETGPLKSETYTAKITNLTPLGIADDYWEGLLCEGRQKREKVILSLAEIRVKEEENKELIDDYQVWFWNYR